MTEQFQWRRVADAWPPNGMVVDTKIDDEQGTRNEQPLRRDGLLWFVPDGSMYVYYKPTHWRQRKEWNAPKAA
jgi:hypothetical protein